MTVPPGPQVQADPEGQARAQELLLVVQDLVIEFGAGRASDISRKKVVRAVDGVTIQVRRGEVLGLIGESGSGKSTIGKTIVGVHKPASGDVSLGSLKLSHLGRRGLRELRRHVQIVFQDPYSSLDPRMHVNATVQEPLAAYGLGSTDERRALVSSLLEDVGLSPRIASAYPHELSGGQRQRVAIARALALKPELIVADEVVSALDVSVQAQILVLLRRLRAETGLAYLFISHDLAVIGAMCDRVAVMYLGKIIEEMPVRDLLSDPGHPYTVGLMSSISVPDPKIEARRERIPLQGDPPNPAAPPTGCRFHPRCWLRPLLADSHRCVLEEPQLVEVGPQHRVACHFVDEVRQSPQRALCLTGLADPEAMTVSANEKESK